MRMKVKEEKRIEEMLRIANGKRRTKILSITDVSDIIERAEKYMEGVAMKYRAGTEIYNTLDLPKSYKYPAIYTWIHLIFDGKYWHSKNCSTARAGNKPYGDEKWELLLSDEAHIRLFPKIIEI